jgi:hypothetical protein
LCVNEEGTNILWTQILEKNKEHVAREEQDREKWPGTFSTRRAINRGNKGRPIPLNPSDLSKLRL